MKKLPLLLATFAAALALTSGCATRTTGIGKETTLLGGAVTVATNSYQPPEQTTVNVDTTKLVGATPTGAKVSLLWGLITFHDY